jgi:hypothetical protein
VGELAAMASTVIASVAVTVGIASIGTAADGAAHLVSSDAASFPFPFSTCPFSMDDRERERERERKSALLFVT